MQRVPYTPFTDGNEIEPFLSARSVRGTLRVQDHDVELTIHTPDLTGCTFSVWGDWGPMYTFELQASASVRFEYACEAKRLYAAYSMPQRKLALHSPVQAAERDACPFFLDLDDGARTVQTRAYLGRDGMLSRLSIKHNLLHRSALEQIFGHLGRGEQAAYKQGNRRTSVPSLDVRQTG